MRLLSLTVTTPNWEEAESQSDIHLVSLGAGVSSSPVSRKNPLRSSPPPCEHLGGSFGCRIGWSLGA